MRPTGCFDKESAKLIQGFKALLSYLQVQCAERKDDINIYKNIH